MNATLHIEHVDESVMRALEAMAQREHVSVEEVARRELLRLRPSTNKNGEHDARMQDKNDVLRTQFGSWTQEEFDEFERNTAPFREIDPDLWK